MSFSFSFHRLRKVKMDQRKLMDNANTITDMAKVTNVQYTIHVQKNCTDLFLCLRHRVDRFDIRIHYLFFVFAFLCVFLCVCFVDANWEQSANSLRTIYLAVIYILYSKHIKLFRVSSNAIACSTLVYFSKYVSASCVQKRKVKSCKVETIEECTLELLLCICTRIQCTVAHHAHRALYKIKNVC